MSNNLRHYAYELSDRIKHMGKYEDIAELLTDPAVLGCHGKIKHPHAPEHFSMHRRPSTVSRSRKIPSPLNYALECKNYEAARAILDVLVKPENKKPILDELKTHEGLEKSCPLGDPLYMHNCIGEKRRPEYFADSPEALELLHSYGYNFNLIEHGQPLYASIISKLGDDITDETKTVHNLKLFETTLRLGANPHIPIALFIANDTSSFKDYSGIALYVFNAFCAYTHAIRNDVDANYDTRCKRIIMILKSFMQMGLDCSELESAASENPNLDSGHPSKMIRLEIITHAHNSMNYYFPEKDPERRRELFTTACAGGKFPELLARCVKSDAQAGTHKETDEAISYLTPYWKNKYSHLIRTMDITLSRTAKTTDSALDKYVRGTSNSGPGVA